MKILNRSLCSEFIKKHADAKKPLQAWIKEVENSEWKNFQEIKARYGSADGLKKGWIVFDIKGNRYRLLTWVDYRRGVLDLQWIGTHAEYDKKDLNQLMDDGID